MKPTPNRSVIHATFSVERTYDAAPARVFAALSTKEAKGKWFNGPPDWSRAKWEMDFRVGGREYSSVGPKGGPQHIFDAQFLDIVENERIIIGYSLYLDDTKISVSQQTIELVPAGKGTRLTLTELGAFLDGHEDPKLREEGTRFLLEALGRAL